MYVKSGPMSILFILNVEMAGFKAVVTYYRGKVGVCLICTVLLCIFDDAHYSYKCILRGYRVYSTQHELSAI